MFGCCGCPGKKANRADSEEADELDKNEQPVANVKDGHFSLSENVKEIPSKCQPEPVVEKTVSPKVSPTKIKFCEGEDNPVAIEIIENEKAAEVADLPSEVDNTVPNLPKERKSSLKQPKPRLSISTEIQIIPSETVVEAEEPSQSPLSDEVFAGVALDPPRPNLGVGLPITSIEFPRSPNLDVPASPRGKAPTPHPKRASMPAILQHTFSEDDDDDEGSGLVDPPVTPVAKDELALRRHRFFADLLAVAQAASEHKVRFDPFGPEVAKEQENANKELEALLERLEKITARLERAVPIFEQALEPLQNSIVVTKSLEDLLDEHLTPVEKEQINGLISDKLISPDSSADVADLSDRDPIPDLIHDEAEPEDLAECLPEDSLPLPDLPTTSSEVPVVKPPSAVENISSCVSLEGSPSRTISDIKDSDTDDNSSDSPDTVVCDSEIPEPEPPSPVKSPIELIMTNSQSTLSMSVQGYQSIVQGPLASYLQLSSQIGGDVAEHAKLVNNVFQAQLQYLARAAQSRKPSTAEEQQLLQPTSQWISAIQEYREKHRSSPLFNHLSAISESIPALGWVAVSPAPSPFVKEMNDAGQFYTNRVLKDWKEKDKKHVEWTKAWVSTLTELQGFVKQHHTTGLVWSGTGAAGVPPPPPGPMPPPPPPLDLNVADLSMSDDRNALFAEINRGDAVTKGLKKVTSDMQTHKNPAMRSGPAPFKAPAASSPSVRAPQVAADKPPVFQRDGKKWLIEHQKNNQNLLVDGAEMNNVVYVFKCTDSVITVKGKINSIFLDSCKKTAVVFDSVVSSVEFVNCQSVQMQVLGNVPTISIDKTDGCQMYLSDKSLAVEIVSSKSSEMNVLVPKGNGDFTEHPIPEQFRTTVGKTGLNTSAVESTG